ncbi:hypothetical protein NHQ30_005077, partial [Ciborinia camelliae]
IRLEDIKTEEDDIRTSDIAAIWTDTTVSSIKSEVSDMGELFLRRGDKMLGKRRARRIARIT